MNLNQIELKISYFWTKSWQNSTKKWYKNKNAV